MGTQISLESHQRQTGLSRPGYATEGENRLQGPSLSQEMAMSKLGVNR
jgi:hypothetical protein